MDPNLTKLENEVDKFKNKLGNYLLEPDKGSKKRLLLRSDKFGSNRTGLLEFLVTNIKNASLANQNFKPPSAPKISSSIGGIFFKQSVFQEYIIEAKEFKTGSSFNTEEQEVFAAYHIASRIVDSKTKYTLEDLKKVKNNITAVSTIEKLYEKASMDWNNSSKMIAEAAVNRASGGWKGLPGGTNFVIEHPSKKSGYIDKVYKKANELLKLTDMPMPRDKWNPGDVWYIHGAASTSKIDDCNSIVELNGLIKEEFLNGNVIPISLKKLERANPNVITKNLSNKVKDVKFKEFDLGKQIFFKSINGNLRFEVEGKAGSADTRVFTGSAISSEITGIGARAGKVSANVMNQYLKKLGSKIFITDYKDVLKMLESKRTQFLDKLFGYAVKYDKRVKNDFKEFLMNIEANYGKAGGPSEQNFLNSKYQVCETVDAVYNLSKDKRDKFVEMAMAYAGSETENSSIHIVIRN